MAGENKETLAPEASTDGGGGDCSMEKDEEMKPISPSSDSSDSDDDLDEAAEDREIETLEKSLDENPANYDAHVEYIRCLRKFGRIEKLRKARETMNERFPLSPKMWQEWIQDEVSLCTSLEAFAEIEKLYERGVQEYLSVPLWCDYLDFVQEHDESVCQCSPDGISKMRNLFERALTAAGLHIMEGNKIWEAYREFEQAVLLTMGDNDQEEKARQIHHVRVLYHRQLSVPLVDSSSTLSHYKLWETEQGNPNDASSEFDGVPSNIVSVYNKAKEVYNARKQYEDQISNPDASDSERLKHFLNYIKFEESSGDPARVQILYERAVLEFPISSDLWLGYTNYLDKTLKVPSVLRNTYFRATRNCTWVGELWVHRLLSLERLNASEKELSEVFEQSIQCAFSSFKEYLDLFLTRVDGLRRRIALPGAKEDELDYALIRDTFERALGYLSPEVLTIDDLLRFHKYWARLEVNLGKDVAGSIGVWERFIKKSGGSTLEVWQSYVAMQIELGQINEARSIYKRCYTKRFPGTGSEDICHAWLLFEREYGTLDDYDLAVKKVTPRLQELMIFRAQQESQTDFALSVKKDAPVVKNVEPKRKKSQNPDDNQPPGKRRKNTSTAYETTTDKNSVETTKENDDAKIIGGHDKPATVASSSSGNKEPHSPRRKNTEEAKPNHYNDECTAFISNLSLEANEEHLRKFFSDCGGLIAIRLLKDKFTGKSRGLAYVDFADDEHLAAAIAKNKQKLLGNKLSIARSNPKQGHKRVSAPASSSQGHGRVQDQTGRSEKTKSFGADKHERREKIKGSVTFAAPRSVVRPLGYSKKDATSDQSSEVPKSNDEFRNMLLKK